MTIEHKKQMLTDKGVNAMNKTEYYKAVKGYVIRVYDKKYRRNLYVKSYHKGYFSLVTDYTGAKGYTLETAKKHAQTLKFYNIWGDR